MSIPHSSVSNSSVSNSSVSDSNSADAERSALARLRFPPTLEKEFGADYDRKVLPGLRYGLLLLLALSVFQGISALVPSHRVALPAWVSAIAAMALVAATYDRRFPAVWQPMIVTTFCLVAYQHLASVAGNAPSGVQGGASIGPFRVNTLLLNEVSIIIVGCALTRLRFAWFAAGAVVIFLLTVLVALHIPGLPLPLFFGGTSVFAVPSLLALLFVAYLQERSARAEFFTNTQLAEERNRERRSREQVQASLHVLSQAIGGVVHDLGNPLTSVRTGAETLQLMMPDTPDMEAEKEILDIICDGALMLDYLRLSLMEQTRVLEGKPIPIHRETVFLRPLVEAGQRYQKPNLASGRKVLIQGEEVEVQADGPKLITVFMNLLGNALKYSSGEIKVAWRCHENFLLCGVLDQGQSSVGITPQQAGQLFVPFGRLNVHAGVEGTGLGLLSAQKIVEAHGGELFIEGRAAGTSCFSTAHGAYPPLLEPGFQTAFVIACPLEVNSAGS